MPNVNFKDFMADNAQANWNVVRMMYGDKNPSLPMVNCECTCIFQWSSSLDRLIQKY